MPPKTAIGALSLLLLCGCTVGPNYQRPKLATPAQFHAPEIDGTVYINDFGPFEELTAGKFYRCEITEAHDYDVVARVIAVSGE